VIGRTAVMSETTAPGERAASTARNGADLAEAATSRVSSDSWMTPGMMSLMATAHLDDGDAEVVLRDFATRHGIRRLALFGSVLRGEETPASDVDLLVEFEEGRTPGLLGLAESELGAVWGGRSSCGPMRTSAGTSGTTSEHRRVCAMQPDDEVRVSSSRGGSGQSHDLRRGSEPR